MKKRLIVQSFILLLSITWGTGFALDEGTPADAESNESVASSREPRTANSVDMLIPNGRGKLISNAWRSTSETESGNTLQWDYQVSAVYEGDVIVKEIRTTWVASASLRNSASIDVGVSSDGVSIGGGSSWETVETPVKYWSNTNGAKTSDYRSNIVVKPAIDYREDTIAIENEAKVVLDGDEKAYEIKASA
ncbi:hypothetical protein ACR6HW_04220 [Fusibacter sp. JL298sf-3]